VAAPAVDAAAGIKPETCDALWCVYRINSPKTAAEVSTIVSWCYLAAGEIERAHGLAQLVLGLSDDADIVTEAELILARTSLSVCDREATDRLLKRALDSAPGGGDAASQNADSRAQASARRLIALRTRASSMFVRRALLDIGIERVDPDPDQVAASRLLEGADAAEQWWQKPTELWVDELPGIRAVLPSRCPALQVAPFVPKPFRPKEPPVAPAREAAAQQVTCEYPKEQSRRHAFADVDIEPKVFRSWVGGMLQGCTRHDPRDLFAAADEIRSLLGKYGAIARALFPAGPLREAIRLATKLPTFTGSPVPGDRRILPAPADVSAALAEAYASQIDEYGILFLAESSDRYSEVKREMASLECRYRGFFVGSRNEDAGAQVMDLATRHYVEAANAAARRSDAPAFLLEAGVLARENDRAEQSCQILQRLVAEHPDSAEALDAHLLIAVSCLKHLGLPSAGKTSYDLEKGAEHLKRVLSSTDLRKREMAFYSLAMIRKDQGRDDEAVELLESVLKLFLGDKVVEWADETIHEYISVCVRKGTCDYSLIGRVNAARRHDSGMYELFKNSLAALDRFEFSSTDERMRGIQALADAALAASRSDEDRALIRLHAALEDVFVAITDETVQRLGEALRYWAAFSGSKDASHNAIVGQALELLTKYVNDIIIVRLWYLDADSFFGDLLGSEHGDTLIWRLFDEVHRGMVYVGAHRQAVRSGLCYARLSAFHASQLEEQLKSPKETRSNVMKGVYWRKSLSQYDAVIERFHRKDYSDAEWDLRGKVLEYMVNSLQDRNPASLALYGKLRQQNLVRIEKLLTDALESGTLPALKHDKYSHDLVVNYVGMSELAGDMNNPKAKQKYLNLAKTALQVYEARHRGSELFREAQNKFVDVSVGIAASGCKGVADCVADGDQMTTLAQKSSSCSTLVRSHTRAAESYAKALAFAKAEEQWERVCQLIETKCTADKLKKDDLDWDSAFLKCKTGGSRASAYLGRWDNALAQVDAGMKICSDKGHASQCLEDKAHIEAAAGRHADALKTLESAVSGLRPEECSLASTMAALSAQICFWANDEGCIERVQSLLGMAADALSHRGCKAAPADTRNIHGAQWYLGLAHWRQKRDKGALDVWAKCGGAPAKAAVVKDEFQLLCYARTYIHRFAEATKIFENVNDISTVNEEYLRLDREALKSVAIIRDASFALVFPETLLALGDAAFVTYNAFAAARHRLDPENKDIIENIRTSAREFRDTVSLLSGQLVTHTTGLTGKAADVQTLNLFFVPPPQYDLVAASKFSDYKATGLPYAVAKTVGSAVLDKRLDTPFFLLEEWCATNEAQYPKEVVSEACNFLGITAALNGELIRAIKFFARARHLHPASRGTLNFALTAGAFKDTAGAGETCRLNATTSGKDVLSLLCYGPPVDQDLVTKAKTVCTARPDICFGETVTGKGWQSLMESLPKSLSTFQGSLSLGAK
jgi:tetratricopeptide (TPR) repeat protein